ncbi:MAG: dTDP-4-dehydrorhamnose reductase, partial [Pseudomonadota bacterium]
MTPNCLVFGGGGQVGRELKRILAEQEIASDFPIRADVDITDADAVEKALRESEYTVVVNTAAYTDVDGAESAREAAFDTNATGAEHVARAAAKRGLPIVHISTDYVFDGTKGRPYVETDPVSPIGIYGLSKEAGERAVREANRSHVILRTAWIFSPFGRNFVKTMLRVAAERDELRVVDDQRGTPTTAADIARAITVIATRLTVSPT